MTGFFKRINFPKIIKILTFAAYPAGLLGMAALAFPVGPIYLFPYRILIPIIWVLILAWAVQQKGRLAIPPLKTQSFFLFLLIWFVYGFLSINWAVNQIDAIRHVIFLFYGFSLISFTVVFLSTSADLVLLYKIWIGLLGLVILLGLYEIFTGNHLPISRFFQTQEAKYRYVPTAVFYNPNDLATYFSLSVSFILSGLLFAKNKLLRLASLVCFGVLLYVFLATDSRINVLAMLLIFAFFCAVAYTSPKNRKELYLAISVIMIVPLVFARRLLEGVTAAWANIQYLADRFVSGVGSLKVRLDLAQNGIEFLISTGGFGVGAGNVETWMEAGGILDTGYITSMHNWFLEVLANYGLFIFTGYILFYLGLTYQTYRVLRSAQGDRQMKMMGVALLGSLIGFFFASMSSSSIIALKPHWMIFAMALAYVNIGLNKSPEEETSKRMKDKIQQGSG